MKRHDADRVLQAAVGGKNPEQGDMIVRGTEFWEFRKISELGTTSPYAITNVTTDRAYDANATSVDELADVLGTLIADLKSKGILS